MTGAELRVEGLACRRGGVAVLEGVSFVLAPGQVLQLRGPNGIGKTTLLRTIAGLQPAEAGRISLPPDSLAYAGHAEGVKAVLSVTENLQFWAAIHGTRSVDATMASMNLSELRDRPARHLSAGQRRRLGLARLLVTGQPVWLLDEPTSSLDTASAALFADVLRGHRAQGGSALIATHLDLGLADLHRLDLEPHRARQTASGTFDGAFA